ncbi:MAG: hypothetical protein M1833_005576 [Piccolia ochrophora]|nr:MAG: hypothetical protein M1833_005576 [Piccolia ochrophora]
MPNSRDVTVEIPMAPVSSNNHNAYNRQPTLHENEKEKGGLFHRHTAGRRVKKINSKGEVKNVGYDGEETTVTQMGVIYSKILNFSIVTRYFLYVLPIGLLIAVPIVIGAINPRIELPVGTRIIWLFTWLEIVWTGLWVSKLVAKLLPYVFQFLCGIVSSGTRKYALVLKALERPLSIAGWALVALATFKPVMTQNPHRRSQGPDGTKTRPWEDTVNNILWAAFCAALIFLGERLIIQLISINYHRTQFNAKIKDSKRNIHLLSLLYDASRKLFPAYCPEFMEEDYLINDSLATSAKGSHQRSGSTTPMRLIRDVGRVGDKLTSAFGNIASEIAGKEVFNPNSAHSIVVEALEKKRSSEALAKRLWMSFVVEGKDALYQDDVIEVLGVDRQEEAEEAFGAIDKDGNGDISLDEMIMAVVEFGRERHSIASSMADVDQAISVLDSLLCTIAFLFVVFVFVGFLNRNFVTTLATTGTALLSLSFMFATTAQEVLGSCIFLFVKHPYDVGDRVTINDAELTVEHISLLFSVFKRLDCHKVVQIPNIVLNQNWIDNVSRSKAMREIVEMYISFDTTMEDIDLLKSELQAFVSSKENSRDFLPDVEIEITGIAEMNKLELKVEVKHKSNWSNETLRAARRSKFMCALVLALRKIPIYAPGGGDAALGDFSKPTYSVSVTDAEAAANRDAFASNKEAKRFVTGAKPEVKREDSAFLDQAVGSEYMNSKSKGYQRTPQDTRPSTGAGTEKTAVEALNSRNPASDRARDDWESYREDMDSDTRRSSDLEEVRGMLRRQSTKGKRHAGPTASPSVPPPIVERATPPPQLGRPRTPPQQALPSTPQQQNLPTPPPKGRSGGSPPRQLPLHGGRPAHPGDRRDEEREHGRGGAATLPATTYGRYQPPVVPQGAPVRSPAGNAFARQHPSSSPSRKPS